jgi:tyrosyl-tRNA synthetase
MNIEEELRAIRRNVVDILPGAEELQRRLQEAKQQGRPLKIKYGVDPTAPDIHLGHTVVLWKLRELQNLGHFVQFIIGDFTAKIGDPSGRNEARKPLSDSVVENNAKTYIDQVFKILDKEKTRIGIFYNGKDWFNKMNLGDFLGIASHYTVARVLERAEFKERFKKNQEITLLEFIYPLLQGYDSVMLGNDIEIGGTDQTFNLLVGRDLQRDYGKKEQVVITMPLLVGTDGVRKMSKSYNNYIGIAESPGEMFGKIMSIPDNMIFIYYRLLTIVPESVIEIAENNIRNGQNPREIKIMLAKEIVRIYHGEKESDKALNEFINVFSRRELPSDMPSKLFKAGAGFWIVDILVENGLAKSKTEANRLIFQGAVELDGKTIKTHDFDILMDTEHILKVGKRKFFKMIAGDIQG